MSKNWNTKEGSITCEEILAFAAPIITGGMIYFLTPTEDAAACAVIWTLIWWFILTVGLALS